MSLLARSLALVAVSLLPAIAIQASNEFDTRRDRQAELKNEADQQARFAAAELRNIISGVRELLTTLTYIPSIRQGEVQECSAILQKLVQENALYLNIATADGEGRILCTALPAAPNITAKGRPYFVAYEENRFLVGNFTQGQSLPVNLIQIANPIRDEGERAIGVIWVALKLEALHEVLSRNLPSHSSLTIFDANGTVLVREPNFATWVGKDASDRLSAISSALRGGYSELKGLDGNTRIFGYVAPAELWGLTVLLGIEKATAFAAIERATLRGVSLIVLGVALALLVSILASRFVLGPPVRRLLETAERWRKGDYSVRNAITGGSTEFIRLAQAFDEMADAVATRERELIKARHLAEERATAAERAEQFKDLLIREINHRIKNNLQLIASLLQVQGSASGDPVIRAQFETACQRVFAVARLHEQLHAGEFGGNVNFADVLKSIVEGFRGSFSDGRIRVALTATPLEISLDQAVPLALAATELMANAFKHAYRAGAGGTVQVGFGPFPGGRLQLTVADDGVGLPESFDPERSGSLGMRILTEMARQIGGALQVQRTERGARFMIVAPLSEPERASA
jgi:two-component sensor histidine kinase/HAMP domain-containing protein